MISVVIPIHDRLELTQLTLLSVIESMGGNPFEVVFVNREGTKVDESLIRGGNFQSVEAGSVEFGPMLTMGASACKKDSSAIFFLCSGVTIFDLPYMRILESLKERPFDVYGFHIAKLINPVTKEVQIYPSWQSLITSTRAFSKIGGFSNYLPIVGGDLLYCLESKRGGGQIRQVKNAHHIFEHYPVAPERVIKIHQELLVKRLPMLMRSKQLRGDVMDGWPGVGNKK